MNAMKMASVVVMLTLWLPLRGALASPVGTAFTYQGQLKWGGAPVNRTCDFQFSLWGAEAGNLPVGPIVTVNAVNVVNGLFSAKLDFGSVFDGNARWLEISARCPAGLGPFARLTPRQELTPTPQAVFTLKGAGGGDDPWLLTGNAGTDPNVNFLGTTDDVALELHVDNQRAVRLEPNTTSPNLIGGYADNSVSPDVLGATIGGGGASGAANRVGTWGTRTWPVFATIGGGLGNGTDSEFSTIGGGANNYIHPNYDPKTDQPWESQGITIGGGTDNIAFGNYATISGGTGNETGGRYATVTGGRSNAAAGFDSTVGGGVLNTARASGATVGGGRENTAGGIFATVAGGASNTAVGDYSFAAGRQAKANHAGAFVWADSSDADFASERNDQFRVQADGGARFDVNSNAWIDIRFKVTGIRPQIFKVIDTSTSAYLTAAGTWTNASDANKKKNFTPVDRQEVLDRLANMAISTWNHKAEDPSIRHIGPTAQDFHAAFGMGGDDKAITTIDADGVAMAAIQGLYEIVQHKDSRIAAQAEELADLRAHLECIEAMVAELTCTRKVGAR